MPTASEFESELRVFEEHRNEWSRSNVGKYVVIRDTEVIETFFNSYADAFSAGMQRFGVERNFLIKQIWISEPVYFVA